MDVVFRTYIPQVLDQNPEIFLFLTIRSTGMGTFLGHRRTYLTLNVSTHFVFAMSTPNTQNIDFFSLYTKQLTLNWAIVVVGLESGAPSIIISNERLLNQLRQPFRSRVVHGRFQNRFKIEIYIHTPVLYRTYVEP